MRRSSDLEIVIPTGPTRSDTNCHLVRVVISYDLSGELSEGAGTSCFPQRRAARDRSALGQTLAPRVANMKDLHRLAIDREENPIDARFAAVEELPHFKGKSPGFRSKGTTFRESGKRRNCIVQREKPTNASFTGVL